MNIAYLISEYPAVSHTFIRREVQELRRRGFEVQCFSIRRPKHSGSFSEVDCKEVESTWYLLPASPIQLGRVHLRALFQDPKRYARTFVEALRHRVPGGRALLWSLFHFVEAILLAEELERRGVTRLHNHFSNAAANVGYLASRYLDLPWSMTLHGSADFDGEGRQLLAAKVDAADFVACISYYGRSQTLRWVAPENWGKILVYRCGIDLSKYQKNVNHENADCQLLTVGRLSAEKGHLGLVEALARVRASGVAFKLTIIGEGPERSRIEAAVQRLGLKDLVSLPGAANESEVAEAISRADVFVLSSFMEGLPVVLIEALASGVPVIAPNVAGIPELVQDSVQGLLFQPSDWEGLSAALLKLISDKELRESLSRAGLQSIQGRFEIQDAVAPLAERFTHD